MSHAAGPDSSITIPAILKMKRDKQKIAMVTCYDSAFAKLVNRSPIDIVLVGDSLGNVVMGYQNTIPVTIEDMIHYSKCVGRVIGRPLLVTDMPFMSYSDKNKAVHNAGRLIQEGLACAVKVEGGSEICDRVEAIVQNGIPVMGHLGLTPQSIHMLGGFKVQAKTEDARLKLLEDAKALERAGAFALVLEMIPADLALEISKELKIPTIGIGAGAGCDGQVLVLHDLLGFDLSFNPKFLKRYANFETTVIEAISSYCVDVKSGQFPSDSQSFH